MRVFGEYPTGPHHPLAGRILARPEWAMLRDDETRTFWFTQLGKRRFRLVKVFGDIERLPDMDLDPISVAWVGLVELRDDDWGLGPAIVEFEGANEAEVDAEVERVQVELDKIVLLNVL